MQPTLKELTVLNCLLSTCLQLVSQSGLKGFWAMLLPRITESYAGHKAEF